jgi:hypothetical protein
MIDLTAVHINDPVERVIAPEQLDQTYFSGYPDPEYLHVLVEHCPHAYDAISLAIAESAFEYMCPVNALSAHPAQPATCPRCSTDWDDDSPLCVNHLLVARLVHVRYVWTRYHEGRPLWSVRACSPDHPQARPAWRVEPARV